MPQDRLVPDPQQSETTAKKQKQRRDTDATDTQVLDITETGTSR